MPYRTFSQVEAVRAGLTQRHWVYGLGRPRRGWCARGPDLRQLGDRRRGPQRSQLLRHCLDFGFTNDPSAIVDLYKYGGGFLLDEQLYLTGQKNKPLANALRRIEGLDPVQPDNTHVGRTRTLTIADSSEPKSIAEISDYGVKIIGAVKGARQCRLRRAAHAGPAAVRHGPQHQPDQGTAELHMEDRQEDRQEPERNRLTTGTMRSMLGGMGFPTCWAGRSRSSGCGGGDRCLLVHEA